jgi:hypothetical protein
MAVLIGLGALIAILLGRREDVITTGITTAVVMVVAELGPADKGLAARSAFTGYRARNRSRRCHCVDMWLFVLEKSFQPLRSINNANHYMSRKKHRCSRC